MGVYEIEFNKISGAVFAGLFEELIYRGFLFGVLHRYCGWRFIWAALPAAVHPEPRLAFTFFTADKSLTERRKE